MRLPEYLKAGEVARLLPVINETRKEQKATSVLLSVLSAVPPFAEVTLGKLGQRIGIRTKINTFTEISFVKKSEVKVDRPDGLIEVVSGKNVWRAIVETKIGRNVLEAEQVTRYLQLAKDQGVDAVLTISNQFTALPNHHPLALKKGLSKHVNLFHLSWTSLLTDALILHENVEVEDPEQAFLIREFVRFLSHESAGVAGFSSMPEGWTTVLDSLRIGSSLQKTDKNLEEVLGAWQQEERDLALLMSRMLGRTVSVKLPRAHMKDPIVRQTEEVEALVASPCLSTTLCIPDAAADVELRADMHARALRVHMAIDAPRDKQRLTARVNWLLRQIKSVSGDDVFVKIIWASKKADASYTLEELRENLEQISKEHAGSEARAFEIGMASNQSRRFAGRKTFIDEVEALVPQFYDRIGQHLQAWQPPAPKLKHPVTEDGPQGVSLDAQSTLKPEGGNSHSALLEIPAFLRRKLSAE